MDSRAKVSSAASHRRWRGLIYPQSAAVCILGAKQADDIDQFLDKFIVSGYLVFKNARSIPVCLTVRCGAVESLQETQIKLSYHFINVGSDLADHQSGVMRLIIGSAKCQQARAIYCKAPPLLIRSKIPDATSDQIAW